MKLKTCPFCGRAVSVQNVKMINVKRTLYYIECKECCYDIEDHKKERLIALWNKRVDNSNEKC